MSLSITLLIIHLKNDIIVLMKKILAFGSILLGIIFVILAGMYWITPAGSLPHYIPGFESGVTTVHFKHGLASLILALALFAYAWFATGESK